MRFLRVPALVVLMSGAWATAGVNALSSDGAREGLGLPPAGRVQIKNHHENGNDDHRIVTAVRVEMPGACVPSFP
jgi:hypothetical protein